MRDELIKMDKEELTETLDRIKSKTPMILDGTISPYQVSRLKGKDKTEYETNLGIRLFIEKILNEVNRWK